MASFFAHHDILAQMTHHFLEIFEKELQEKSINYYVPRLVVENSTLKTTLEETKQMLNISKDALENRGYSALAHYF